MPEGIAVDQGGGPQVTTQVQRVSESGFVWPDRVPWSELGPEFIETYGHSEDGKLQAEHLEVTGQSGSGKSYAIATILQQRAQRWDTAEVAVLTKQADDSLPKLGWPVIDDRKDLRDYKQVMFWPETDLQGQEREKFHEKKVYDLLAGLWPGRRQQNPMVLYLDEVRYLEGLSNRLKAQVRQYWREGRSHGISLIAGAQRPIGMVRDQHSESRWKIVFAPADAGDMQRFAELLGRWKDWQPVLEDLDQTTHEFVLRNSLTKDAYISWIDEELRPLPSQVNQKRQGSAPYGKQKKAEGKP